MAREERRGRGEAVARGDWSRPEGERVREEGEAARWEGEAVPGRTCEVEGNDWLPSPTPCSRRKREVWSRPAEEPLGMALLEGGVAGGTGPDPGFGLGIAFFLGPPSPPSRPWAVLGLTVLIVFFSFSLQKQTSMPSQHLHK